MSEPKIGLALGGGSARGLAHITMLEAFDELGIRPYAIVGTSAGALIGSAYASGMPAAEIREHARSLLGRRLDAARHILTKRSGKLRDLFAWNGLGSVQIDGEELTRLALPEQVASRIEDTAIAFSIVTTDFYGQCEMVLSRGSMVSAVAASIAIPGVISAPVIDGKVLVDGGMTNPVPFDKLPDECDRTIAIDVTGKPVPKHDRHPSNTQLMVGAMLTMFHQIAELRRRDDPPDAYLMPIVEAFQAPDFFRIDEILEAAKPEKERLKRVLESFIDGN